MTIGGSNATTINIGRSGQTAVIKGNLQVDGTTTTVNSATLDVTDANITVNNGGNQVSADGTAGLTVEMSDATDVALIYDSTATSRFKVGDAGSEVEIATISGSQTLTNKTISGGTISGTIAGTPTFSSAITFTTAPVFSSTTASQVLAVDGSKNLTSHVYTYELQSLSANKTSAGTMFTFAVTSGKTYRVTVNATVYTGAAGSDDNVVTLNLVHDSTTIRGWERLSNAATGTSHTGANGTGMSFVHIFTATATGNLTIEAASVDADNYFYGTGSGTTRTQAIVEELHGHVAGTVS
jgi:hypothetical protein